MPPRRKSTNRYPRSRNRKSRTSRRVSNGKRSVRRRRMYRAASPPPAAGDAATASAKRLRKQDTSRPESPREHDLDAEPLSEPFVWNGKSPNWTKGQEPREDITNGLSVAANKLHVMQYQRTYAASKVFARGAYGKYEEVDPQFKNSHIFPVENIDIWHGNVLQVNGQICPFEVTQLMQYLYVSSGKMKEAGQFFERESKPVRVGRKTLFRIGDSWISESWFLTNTLRTSSCPFLCRVFEVKFDRGSMLMEAHDVHTLQMTKDGGMTPDVRKLLYWHLTCAVEYMHNRLHWYHRAIKLDNIVYNCERNLFVVIDFGAVAPRGYTLPGVFGTHTYTPSWLESSEVNHGVDQGCVCDVYGILMCMIIVSIRRFPWRHDDARDEFKHFQTHMNESLDTCSFFATNIQNDDFRAIQLIHTILQSLINV